MLGVFTAGRILNEKTARSQALGGVAWGIGSALHEEAVSSLEKAADNAMLTVQATGALRALFVRAKLL